MVHITLGKLNILTSEGSGKCQEKKENCVPFMEKPAV